MADNEKPATCHLPPAAAHRVALLICGALARETLAIVGRHGWDVAVCGVSAQHHLRPGRIAPAVESRLRELIPQFARLIVVYGDCGSGGALDAVLERYNVPRVSGPHCYEMYGGPAVAAMQEQEPGTFFLTDYLVRSFNGAVWRGLGIERHPELKQIYFANYRRVVYLIQRADEGLLARAEAIAAALGLPLELRHTGYGLLEARLVDLMAEIFEERYRPALPAAATRDDDGELPDTLLARHPGAGAGPRRRRAGRRGPGEPLPGGG